MNRPKPFDLLSHAKQNIRGAIVISATIGYEGPEDRLFAVQIEDGIGSYSVQMLIQGQDQQTVSLYRDERTEVVIEQRPVRPLRRITDVKVQTNVEKL